MSINTLNLDSCFEEYIKLYEQFKMKDVYYDPYYLKAVQNAENSLIEIFIYEENGVKCLVPYVKRRINDLSIFKNIKEEFWDISTPHEYSGIITNSPDANNFYSCLGEYCQNNNIIFEFSRFNPFLKNEKFIENSGYNLIKCADNIYIGLTDNFEDIYKSFHRSVRKNIKRAVNSNLKFLEAEPTDENIKIFIEIYSESMDRLCAKKYFYFNNEYFQKLLKECSQARLFFIKDKNEIIAASILLHHENRAHHHLTGYKTIALDKRPNDFMIYSLIQWCQNSNIEKLHLGGGSEPIRAFKSKFSQMKIPYYIGYKIHNKEIYDYLCSVWKNHNPDRQDITYYPPYRY